MSLNQFMYDYGAQKSSIREIAAYASARKAEVGAENVFDFSLGNPSVPAPQQVTDAIRRCLALPPQDFTATRPHQGCRAAARRWRSPSTAALARPTRESTSS